MGKSAASLKYALKDTRNDMHFRQSHYLLFKLRYYDERKQNWPWGKQHRPFQKMAYLKKSFTIALPLPKEDRENCERLVMLLKTTRNAR